MKKNLIIFCTCFLFNMGSIFAILPPLYQGIAEIKAILDDKKLGQLLHSGEVLEDIRKVDEGYLITTNHHRLPVTVIYLHSNLIGPAQFKLEFHEPISK